MTALEYLLDGLEAELELERELGVRTVEIDRSLLVPELGSSRVNVGSTRVRVESTRVAVESNRVGQGSSRVELGSARVGVESDGVGAGVDARRASRDAGRPASPPPGPNLTPSDPNPTLSDPNSTLKDATPTLRDSNSTLSAPNRPYDFLFLHDRPLSPGGIEMMAKIITAMHRTPESAPIVFTGERPAARIYVVLGDWARKKWFPALNGAPGKWLHGPGGEDVLITYSPEYILRFGPVTPAVKKIKVEMWTSLKGVLQRLKS